MPIAITDTHRELEQVARAFLEKVGARAEARALLDAPEEGLPAFWDDLVGLGWLGLHLPEAVGGSGYGIPELVVVLQELGRAVAPGPFLPTVLASSVIATAGTDGQKAALLPALADGSRPAALGLGGDLRLDGDVVSGDGGIVLGAGLADLFLLVAGDDVIAVDRDASGCTVTIGGNLDPTRRSGRVVLENVAVPADRVFRGAAPLANDLARVLVGAEAAGARRSASTARPSTRRCASNSAARSRCSRPSSTTAPTCSSRRSSEPRQCGTPRARRRAAGTSSRWRPRLPPSSRSPRSCATRS